jgi:dTDP-glucose pyrophosphorylase
MGKEMKTFEIYKSVEGSVRTQIEITDQEAVILKKTYNDVYLTEEEYKTYQVIRTKVFDACSEALEDSVRNGSIEIIDDDEWEYDVIPQWLTEEEE